MKIIITDTNVFIDLIQSGALRHFFLLNYEFCTTDLVIEEIQVPVQRLQLEEFIKSGALRVISLDSSEIRAAVELPTQCNLKRITDKSVLLKAIQIQCLVLSGDGNLRKECIRNGLEVHGSIWIIKEIWMAGLSEPKLLITMLEKLQQNTRLPEKEVERLKNEIAAA